MEVSQNLIKIAWEEDMKGITIVLPSLDPDEKLNMVVQGLLAEGFHDIVIVNDGSDADHLSPFEEAAKHVFTKLP